jgi:hypothetical protein
VARQWVARTAPSLADDEASLAWYASWIMRGASPGAARLVAVVGNEQLPWEGDQEPVLDEIERFLGAVRDEAEPDRVLTTVLFTDVVSSTAKAAEIGW